MNNSHPAVQPGLQGSQPTKPVEPKAGAPSPCNAPAAGAPPLSGAKISEVLVKTGCGGALGFRRLHR